MDVVDAYALIALFSLFCIFKVTLLLIDEYRNY